VIHDKDGVDDVVAQVTAAMPRPQAATGTAGTAPTGTTEKE